MQKKRILILMGYDYVNAICDLVADSDIFLLITQNNTQFFLPENLEKLESIMANRLIISNNSKSDIQDLLYSGEFSTLLTLGWRKLIDLAEFSNLENLINVHPALLPEYKGYHPVPYVLLNEERFHGITAHHITSEMDAGDIILRHEFEISPFSTLQSLQYLIKKQMQEFLDELFSLIRSGVSTVISNQEEKTRVRAPKRRPEDSEVNLTDTVEEMFRKVKASDISRFPAYFIIYGQKVYIRLYRDENVIRQTEFDI